MEIRLAAPLSHYAATSDGEVIGYWRGRVVLKGSLDKDGYRRFTLIGDEGEKIHARRSVLVCEAFHGPRPIGNVVRHGPGSYEDDRPANLCWGTQKQNIADKDAADTVQWGERNPKAKLRKGDVLRIVASPERSLASLAREMGVTTTAVWSVRRGRTWTRLTGIVPKARRFSTASKTAIFQP